MTGNLNRSRNHVRDKTGMFVSGEKERKRSDLQPGKGGSGYRRKQNLILTCSIIIGLGVAVMLATLMYWLDQLGP